MSNNPEMITIKKIVTKKEDNSLSVERDYIRINEIKSFRNWRKVSDEERKIDGYITLVQMVSHNGKEAFYNIQINESDESFSKRLGDGFVIGL